MLTYPNVYCNVFDARVFLNMHSNKLYGAPYLVGCDFLLTNMLP